MALRLDYSQVHFQNNGKLKLLIVVGTRPEIIRLSQVIKKCRRYFDCLLAHTGQNYDYSLNGVFFKDLKLDAPEVYMDAAGDDLGATVGNIVNCSYKLMVQTRPDALLVLGDTNSCLSAIAAKRSVLAELDCAAEESLLRQLSSLIGEMMRQCEALEAALSAPHSAPGTGPTPPIRTCCSPSNNEDEKPRPLSIFESGRGSVTG